ncbi:ABC transporter substrate-binding protein [Mesorhizobium sp. M0830]|uniref:ABC transporter substrate-binding protein n=1 Tax=unclassified Mesorhizobium TaxID=325217 RepID=UPI00333A45BD
MLKNAISVSLCGVFALLGTDLALANKADDTLRIVWGVDGVMVNADNYYGATRTGIWFDKMVFDTLIDRDPLTGDYKPNLATAWKWIDDTTLEFTLRQGVKFHNGEPFGADDVVYTYNTVAHDDGVKFKRIVSWIDKVEKVDQYKVRIHTKGPFPQAIEFLAGPMPIYPNEYYKSVGSAGMSNKPIGTGPLKVVEMKPGNEYVLIRNDDYTWGSPKGAAKIKNVIVREIPDAQTQVAEIMSGGADVSADMTPDLVKQLKDAPGVAAANAETYRVFYMGLDAMGRTKTPAIQDIRVRQALNYAIDRKAIVENLMAGAARVIDTPCHPLQFGCDQAAAVKYPYDPKKAKALLAEAGFKDGLELPIYAEAPAYEAEAVMGYLAAVGIKTTLNRLPWEAYRDAQVANKTPLFLTNWGSYSLADASASTSVFFNGGDDDFAHDQQVIDALKLADTSTDPGVRKEHYSKAIARITSQAYWVPMFSGIRSYTWNSDLDFRPYPDEIPRFYEYGWK